MILVTGGSGLLGSHLITELLMNGQQLKVLIRSEASKHKISKVIRYYSTETDVLLKQVEWVYGDILDTNSLYRAVEGIDYVYHCAAVVSFDTRDRQSMLDINIRGTANIVNVCLDNSIKKLVHISSIAAIRDSSEGNIVTEENGWPSGNTLNYSYSKTQGEFEVWRGIAEGLNAVIINPSIILGPGDWNSGSSKFFHTIYKGLKFYTRGVTGFVDVYDVVKVMIALMDSEIHSQRFIVSAENISYENLFKKIADALGVKGPSVYASPYLTIIGRYIDSAKSAILFSRPLITKQTAKSAHNIQFYSSEKLLKALGFSYTPLEKTIQRISKLFIEDLDLK